MKATLLHSAALFLAMLGLASAEPEGKEPGHWESFGWTAHCATSEEGDATQIFLTYPGDVPESEFKVHYWLRQHELSIKTAEVKVEAFDAGLKAIPVAQKDNRQTRFSGDSDFVACEFLAKLAAGQKIQFIRVTWEGHSYNFSAMPFPNTLPPPA